MQDRLRDQMIAYLAENRIATLCAAGTSGGSPALVPYRSRGLTLECWVPRWTESWYHLEQGEQVNLVIALGDQHDGLRWLFYQGRAELAPAEDPSNPAVGTNPLYCRVRVAPRRIDLIDEQQGPGIRASLESIADPG